MTTKAEVQKSSDLQKDIDFTMSLLNSIIEVNMFEDLDGSPRYARVKSSFNSDEKHFAGIDPVFKRVYISSSVPQQFRRIWVIHTLKCDNHKHHSLCTELIAKEIAYVRKLDSEGKTPTLQTYISYRTEMFESKVKHLSKTPAEGANKDYVEGIRKVIQVLKSARR